MTIVKRITLCIILISSNLSFCFDSLTPLTTDNRLKTYIYSPNEVYLLVLHYGYQSHIEFAQGEIIKTMTVGDSYSWKMNSIGNRLFIKPLEKNLKTNMTIITNFRTYQFDLVARDLDDDDQSEENLVYQVKFYYPKKRVNNVR